MQGERLDESPIGPRGLAGDRAYGLIDVETGHLCSAKHPRKYGALFGCHASFVDEPIEGGPVAITLPDGSIVRTDDAAAHQRLSALVGREIRLESAAPA